MALGNTYPEIRSKCIQKYDHEPSISTLTRIRNKQRPAINEAQEYLTREEVVGANVLKQKSYKLINKKLDRAINDDSEIDRLRAQLKAGEIDRKEFDQECTRYEVMTINELTKVSDSMNNHLKGGDETPALTAEDQAALQMLMAGLNSGNPFQLIQVLNPVQNNLVLPNVSNPVPQADTAGAPV